MLKLHSLEPAKDGTDRVIMDVELYYEWTGWQRWFKPIHLVPGRRLFIGTRADWKTFPKENPVWLYAYRGADHWSEPLYRLWRDHERGER